MSSGNDYIALRRVLKDYLKEQGIALKDLFGVMDKDKEGIMEALSKRVHLTRAQSKALERELSSKDLPTTVRSPDLLFAEPLGNL